MSALPAAAIAVGDTVVHPETLEPVEVTAVHNSTPRGGRIVWEVDGDDEVEVGGSDAVSVVSYGKKSRQALAPPSAGRSRR